MKPHWLLSLISFLLGGGLACADEPKTVLFWRPDVPHTRYEVVCSAKFDVHQTSTLAGEKLPDTTESTRAKLDGTLVILRVNQRGLPSELFAKVREFTYHVDGRPKVVLKPGSELTMKHGKDGKIVQINGRKASPEEVRAFAALLDVYGEEDTLSPGDWYNPKGQVRVGDSWNIDSQSIATHMRKTGGDFHDPQGISGLVKYAMETTHQGMPAHLLHLKSTWRAAPSDVVGNDGTRTLRFTMEEQQSVTVPTGRESTFFKVMAVTNSEREFAGRRIVGGVDRDIRGIRKGSLTQEFEYRRVP